jgi:DNA-binding NarL/FixJ family response regulator
MLATGSNGQVQQSGKTLETNNISAILTKEDGSPPSSAFAGGQFAAKLPNLETDRGRFPNVAVIDPRCMLRECVVRFVTSHQRLTAIGYTSVDEMIQGKSLKEISLIVLYAATNSKQPTLDDMVKLRNRGVTCPVVVLVDTSDCSFVREFLQNGARGVVPTAFQANVVLEAIHFVLAGGTYAPVESFMSVQQLNALHPQKSAVGLTTRESQIIGLLRSGKPNKQIAYELDLSLGTVKVHLQNIMKKLGAHNRLQVLANQDVI